MDGLTKILVVDDEPQLLVDALPLYGFEVIAACDGIEGIAKLNDNMNNIDLVILDVNMPRMNGWEFLKTVRSNEKFEQIPILMLTGIQGEEKEVASLKFGADDYIVKPYRLPTLIAHIEALIRRSKVTHKSFISTVAIPNADEDQPIETLSKREREILLLVAEGKSNKDIGDILSIQEVTVKSHLKKIFKKLNVTNRMQAAMLALKLNLLK